jgi:ABC-type nitrate/sulfonate/bicarbonate transport system substrate-binding protein
MFGQLFSCFSAARRVVPVLFFLLALLPLARPSVHAQTTKIIVAYTSATSNFTGGWLAKLEGIFRKYNLDVELVLMQGPSTYLPAPIE